MLESPEFFCLKNIWAQTWFVIVLALMAPCWPSIAVLALGALAGGLGEPMRGENAPSTPGVPRCAFAPPLPPRVRRAGTMRRLAAFPTRGPRGALRPAPSGPALSLRASAASSARDERDAMDMAAAKVQRWLEDVYEAVDYEAALVRAGVLDPADLLPAAVCMCLRVHAGTYCGPCPFCASFPPLANSSLRRLASPLILLPLSVDQESEGPDEGKRDVAGTMLEKAALELWFELVLTLGR